MTFHALLELAVPFFAAFFFVGVSAFQQRNITHERYVTMFGTTIVRAFVEAAVVIAFVSQGFHVPTILAIGVGGGLGCVVSVKLSKRIFHD